MRKTRLKTSILALFATMLLLAGCNKKAAIAAPPTPPTPPVPTATLAASPSVIQQGQTTVLSWQTTNSTEITIAGLGTVSASGSRSMMPDTSRTYNLEAKGPGGNQEATARVTVNPASAAKAPTPEPSEADLFGVSVKDVFFDFDKASIRSDEVNVTDNDGHFLAQHPHIKILVEGHCDDRGSVEYNIALGDNRAQSLKDSLQAQGITSDRIATISYGKEKPFCTADNEQCWQQNRRDHVVFEH